MSARVRLDIPRQKPERGFRVFFAKVVHLLIGQCLDGRTVNDALAGFDKMLNRELGGQGFARTGGGAYKGVVPIHDGLDGLLLEGG